MMKRLAFILLAAAVATSALAQGKKRIEKAADMPRFMYKVEGKLEDLVRSEAAFRKFAAEVRRDIHNEKEAYEIADKAAQRGLMGMLVQLDLLEGRYAEAAKPPPDIPPLEERPADKRLSGRRPTIQSET